MRILALLLLLSVQSAFGQGTPIPVDVIFPQIAIGGDAGGQNYVTLLQIVNNNSTATTGHLILYADTGAPLAVLFNGEGPHSSMDIELASGEARQLQLTLNGPVTAGWMEITYSPAEALTTLILQFRSGTTLLSEVGVQESQTLLGADLAVETDAALNTGLAFANPDIVARGVLVSLLDPGTGAQLSAAAVRLPAKGHVALFLTELFAGVPQIGRMRAKLSLDACLDPSCSTSGGGFVATAIRLNGDRFTTIPIAAAVDGGAEMRILPQVAFGGPDGGLNMKTVLYFTTNVPGGVTATAEIFDNDGNPLTAFADGEAASSSIAVTVPGNRVSRIVLGGDQTLRSGWIRLTLSPGVHCIASAVFQTFNGPDLVSEASVLESAPISRGLIHVKTEAGNADVGIALANSQSTTNTITLQLFDREGFVAAIQHITLPPNGHLARFVTEIFPQLASRAEFEGAVSLHGSTGFSALALRLSADKIATLPVAANGMYRPTITALRVTMTQRLPAQVTYEIDITDFDSDAVTTSDTMVEATAFIDFGNAGYDTGGIGMDGTSLLNRPSGTLKGSFPLPHVTSSIPAGTRAAFYIEIADSAGNLSNVLGALIQF